MSRRGGLRNRAKGRGDQKLSPQELFNQISRAIAGATEHQFFTYECVEPEAGSLVAHSLNQDGKVERVAHRYLLPLQFYKTSS